LVKYATLVLELDGPPVLLMMWLIVPTPPSETVTMSWNLTPDTLGTSKARSATTLELELK
jgi:hypothetical protein